MDDVDLMRWADDGGFQPDDPDPPSRPGHLGWYLTYAMLRRLFL